MFTKAAIERQAILAIHNTGYINWQKKGSSVFLIGRLTMLTSSHICWAWSHINLIYDTVLYL